MSATACFAVQHYMPTCLPTAAHLPAHCPADDVSGSLLRLLHQLASSPAAAETLARCVPPAVPPLLGALCWGTGAAVLALESLKRALAPSNRWRDNLVASCLRQAWGPCRCHCHGLFLAALNVGCCVAQCALCSAIDPVCVLLCPPCSAGLVPLLLQRLDWRREQGGREVRCCCRLLLLFALLQCSIAQPNAILHVLPIPNSIACLPASLHPPAG
jgi:hypothetical protein